MAAAIVFIICIINIVLWVRIFSRLKKMFSTDGVVENVKIKLNTLLIQIDSATDRNLKLLNKEINELKLICAEADNRIKILQDKIDQVKKSELLKSEAEHLRQSKDFEERVYAPAGHSSASTFSPAAAYQKEQSSYMPSSVSAESIDDSAVKQETSVSSENTFVNIPEVRVADELIKPKKEFKTIVKELRNLGYSVEEIAAETGKSTQEVKIILEFS